MSDIWSALAGPAVLGRSLLIFRGDDVPTRWVAAEKVVLDDSSLLADVTLRSVRHAYLTRTPVVYEVEPELTPRVLGVHEGDVWDVSPRFDFIAESTWRLATLNSVDARVLHAPAWWLSTLALNAGATPSLDGGGDVVLPDGTAVWCDGGPLYLWGEQEERLRNVAVVPLVSLMNGLLTPLRPSSPRATLAPDQLRAVADPAMRARIIAPAGSGKTRVLTERSHHLLDAGVPSESLLLVAFNRRAQREISDRTSRHPGLQVQTLNALALSILNGTSGFASRGVRLRTIGERDVRDAISRLVTLPRRTNTDPAAPWLDALSEVRLGLKSPALVEHEYRGDLTGFADFFPRYREHLAEHGSVDFDEQIYLAIEVLLREPAVRRVAERRAEVLLIDEFQDLTPAHMLLLRLLAGPALSIFAVGDDDQSIYGFSGATPEWLVRFAEHVPEAVHHALEVNYRCPAPVVAATLNLLTHNATRVTKVIRPGPSTVGASGALRVALVDDQVREVVAHVRDLLDSGAATSDIVVLSRVNALLVPIQVALVDAGVGVTSRDGDGFLRSSGVESALAWLRLAVRPERLAGVDVDAASRRPGRGLSPKVRGWMGEQIDRAGLVRLARRLDASSSAKVLEFITDLDRVAAHAEDAVTSGIFEFIRRDIGLDRALSTLDATHQGRNTSSHSDGLRSLAALGRQHPDPRTFDDWLRTRLAVPPLENGVVLATVHRVKGLEWPHVVLFDASDTIFPHRLSTDVEEERRVFHVALTRCSTSLLVTSEASSPSIFVAELTEPAPVPAHGQREDSAARRLSRATPTLEARIGSRFIWGGYECVVRAVGGSGVVTSVGATTTTVPFGSRVHAGGAARVLVPAPPTPLLAEGAPSTAVSTALHQALKAWRLLQARADRVPAFVIFNDRTLDELARAHPRDEGELLAIRGVGPTTVDRYGDQILAIVRDCDGA